MRSLTVKLILAFLLISVIGIGLAAVLARVVTGREFDRFVMDRARSEFLANAASYYQTHGSWDGAGDYFRQSNGPPGPGARPQQAPFVLVDQSGTVVVAAGPDRAGKGISPKDLARGKAIEVNGHNVGTVLDAVQAPALNAREAQYLASTNRALWLAALGAMVIAVLLAACRRVVTWRQAGL